MRQHGPLFQFEGTKAFAHVQAQVDFGARPTGSAAAQKTANYIVETLRSLGWNAVQELFLVTVAKRPISACNVIGSLGSGSVIILGTHYDTRMYADIDPGDNEKYEPVIGANDGASGVAVLLELARILSQGYKLQHEIRLAFWDAEDNGKILGWPDWILGSTHYVENLDIKPEYVINLDMVGSKSLSLYYEGFSMESACHIVGTIWEIAANLGYGNKFIRHTKYWIVDDHIPFTYKNIPAIDIIDMDYPYRHKTSDTIDKISVESLEIVGRTVQKYLEQTCVATPMPCWMLSEH